MQIFPSMTLGVAMMMHQANHHQQKAMIRSVKPRSLVHVPGQDQSPGLQDHRTLEAKALHHLPARVLAPAQGHALGPVPDHLEVQTLAARRTQNLGQGNRVTTKRERSTQGRYQDLQSLCVTVCLVLYAPMKDISWLCFFYM